MLVHKVEGKLHVAWREDAKAIVDTWTSYGISLADFKDAVMVKGLSYARRNGGIAWIVDSSTAQGNFSQEIQDFIGAELFPMFVRNGVRYFITINSKVSALTKMTVSRYAAKVGPAGMKLVEVASVEDAVTWLKANARAA